MAFSVSSDQDMFGGRGAPSEMIKRLSWSTLALVTVLLVACEWPQREALREPGRAEAVLSACLKAMDSLPPPGPAIDGAVYQIEPGNARWEELQSALAARTVRFDGPREGKNPVVSDARLPPEILALQPLWVEVTPDNVHVGLCGAGMWCSVEAVRSPLGREVFAGHVMGSENCEVLVPGLWYCRES
jgi:hypothetical protein